MKWADYCISKVRYNPRHTHITHVTTIQDLGDKWGKSEEIDRQTVIDRINKGTSFITMTLGMDEWKKGQPVQIININNKNYIKTVPNQTEDDNLGELSEY